MRTGSRKIASEAGGWELEVEFPTSDSDSHLRADDRLETRLLCCEMEARRAVDAVAIEQRERAVAERGRALDQRFG
jgi:hypothetical protein